MKNPFAELKSLPKNQRVAIGVGTAGALGAGVYTYRRKKATGKSSAPAPAAPASAQSALTPGLDPTQQYGVLIPVNWQDGANFGGTAGLTGPLNPSNPANPPAPVTTPGGGGGAWLPAPYGDVHGVLAPGTNIPAGDLHGFGRNASRSVLVGGQPVPDWSNQVPVPVITPDSTTFFSFPQALAPPTAPVSFYNTNTRGYTTIQPGQPGQLGSNVWAALLANPYVSPSLKRQASNAFSGIESV